MSGLAIYRSIPLTQGKVAWVDQADYAEAAQFGWYAYKSGIGLYYAGRRGGGVTKLRMHRVVLGLQPGDGIEADHKNGNGLDNRRGNLRSCTHAQNVRNRRKRAATTSRFKGVSWAKREARWRAQIDINRGKYHLGYFMDEVEAALAYDTAALDLHGKFARLNFPGAPA